MKKTLEAHYATDGLRERLEAGLKNAGIGDGPVDWKSLAGMDQFHTRGLQAVMELASMLGPREGDHILDLGSGFGGPARYIAAELACQVTGIDLTQLYVDVANDLTVRCGLSGKASFVQGDATHVPFQDASFDHAWTLHVSMNISDKAAFYGEAFRVLKPGGKFALYDVAEGNGDPVLYPAPWSPTEETSFLATIPETESQLKQAGFQVVAVEDATAPALEWLKQIQSAPAPDPNTLDLRQVLGAHVAPMLKNMAQNFLEGRTRVVKALAVKPD